MRKLNYYLLEKKVVYVKKRGMKMEEKRVDFKSMTKQEKRDYIWYYYKNHMLIGLFSIVLIGSLVYDVASKNQIVFSDVREVPTRSYRMVARRSDLANKISREGGRIQLALRPKI